MVKYNTDYNTKYNTNYNTIFIFLYVNLHCKKTQWLFKNMYIINVLFFIILYLYY